MLLLEWTARYADKFCYYFEVGPEFLTPMAELVLVVGTAYDCWYRN